MVNAFPRILLGFSGLAFMDDLEGESDFFIYLSNTIKDTSKQLS